MSKKPNDMNRMIGEKIFRLRRSLGLTQQKLSERMGISITFLSEIENGHKSMSVDTLVKFARNLHVSLDTIVQDQNPSDDIQKDVVSMMSALPLEYNESILIIAREMTRIYQEKTKSADSEQTSADMLL